MRAVNCCQLMACLSCMRFVVMCMPRHVTAQTIRSGHMLHSQQLLQQEGYLMSQCQGGQESIYRLLRQYRHVFCA